MYVKRHILYNSHLYVSNKWPADMRYSVASLAQVSVFPLSLKRRLFLPFDVYASATQDESSRVGRKNWYRGRARERRKIFPIRPRGAAGQIRPWSLSVCLHCLTNAASVQCIYNNQQREEWQEKSSARLGMAASRQTGTKHGAYDSKCTTHQQRNHYVCLQGKCNTGLEKYCTSIADSVRYRAILENHSNVWYVTLNYYNN